MIKKAPHLILIIKVKSSLLSRFLVTLERAWSLATLDTVNLSCWKSLITLALNTHTHTQGVSHSFLPCSLPLLPVFPLPLSYLLVVPQHRDSDDLTIMGAHVLSRFSQSDSLRPCGPQPARLLCPWHAPGKNTGVGCCALLQGVVPTQASNLRLLCLLHCIGRQVLYYYGHLGSPWQSQGCCEHEM